jgi:hypothetical protein
MTPLLLGRRPGGAKKECHNLTVWAKDVPQACILVLSISPDPLWKEMESIWG